MDYIKAFKRHKESTIEYMTNLLLEDIIKAHSEQAYRVVKYREFIERYCTLYEEELEKINVLGHEAAQEWCLIRLKEMGVIK